MNNKTINKNNLETNQNNQKTYKNDDKKTEIKKKMHTQVQCNCVFFQYELYLSDTLTILAGSTR